MEYANQNKGGEPLEQVLIGYICVLFLLPLECWSKETTAAGGAVAM